MSEPVLKIENLRVNFGSNEAVKGVSLEIAQGETVAVVGESGSGKSVTALSVLQLLPYPMASHPSGSITVAGEQMIGASAATLQAVRGAVVSMIFQEPMTSLNPLHTVVKQIGETLMFHKGMSARAARARSLELLKRVRLADAEAKLNAYPHQLSGGQRQRVMIAMALANEPRLLIADEPTTALDVTIQARILSLLKALQKEFGMSLMLISHDLGIVRAMADRVCVMTEGELVETATTEQIFKAPVHTYTRHLLAAEPKGHPTPVASTDNLVVVRDLCVDYAVGQGWFGKKQKFQAVKKLSFNLKRGQTLGVVGESGSGKTTLGFALLRLLKSAGHIEIDGDSMQDLSAAALKAKRANVQVVFQDPFGSLSPRLSLLQIVGEGLLVHEPHLTREQRQARVAEALEEVGLEASQMNRYPHEFSGGQRQRISIARALALKPDFLVLDEPTSALDMSVQAQIVDLLRDIQQRHQMTYLFISHDLKVVRAMAHEIIVMKDGEVVEAGTADQIFDNPQTQYTQELMSAAFVR